MINCPSTVGEPSIGSPKLLAYPVWPPSWELLLLGTNEGKHSLLGSYNDHRFGWGEGAGEVGWLRVRYNEREYFMIQFTSKRSTKP